MENKSKAEVRPKNAREFIKSWNFWKPFLGIVTGGIAGFLYYRFVGCNSGSCPITSHSYMTIIFGGLLGYLITSSLK